MFPIDINAIEKLREHQLPACGPPCAACRGRGRLDLFLTVEDPCRACRGTGGPRWRRPPIDVMLLGGNSWMPQFISTGGPPRPCMLFDAGRGYPLDGAPLDVRERFESIGGTAGRIRLGLILSNDYSTKLWTELGKLEWRDGADEDVKLQAPLALFDTYQSMLVHLDLLDTTSIPAAVALSRELAELFGPVDLSLTTRINPFSPAVHAQR